MEKVYGKTKTIREGKISGFCPDCTHSTVIEFIGEVPEGMELVDHAARVLDIGCYDLHMNYITHDNITVPRDRICAVTTGMKYPDPDSLVFTYQGDGDFTSIGLTESISTANQGENITVILVNDGIYGVTGSQMTPTTLVGMKISTAPHGRDSREHDYPMHMCEILNQLTAPAHLVHTSCNTPANVNKTKQAIHKAFQSQLDGKGLSMAEIVAGCPTNWGLDPMRPLGYIEEKMLPEFPLDAIRDRQRRKANMETNLCVAGFGGQGVMILGELPTGAICNSIDKNIASFPSYGAEQRGGTASCFVAISDDPTGAPLSDVMDGLIVMNDPPLKKFIDTLKSGGTLLTNSSIISDDIGRNGARLVKTPVTGLALEMGSAKVLSVIMLGAYVGYIEVIDPAIVRQTIEYKPSSESKLLLLSRQAFGKGLELGYTQKQ